MLRPALGGFRRRCLGLVSSRSFKVGAGDPYYSAMLDLDYEKVVELMDENQEAKNMTHAMHALWALVKVDSEKRAVIANDERVKESVVACIDTAIAENNQELCAITVEFIHMAETAALHATLLEKAKTAFPEVSVSSA